MSDNNNTVQHVVNGDSEKELKKIPNETVDLVVSDPPYGYSFMGKDWDKAVPSVAIWKECLRVLKPGAFAFIMSAPRQDVLSQMIVRLGMAGFDTSFTSIYWTYASGFPKAANVGKLVDKRNGRHPEEFKQLGDYIKARRQELNIPTKDVSGLFPSKTGGLTGCLWNWENGENVPTKAQWITLKEKLQLDNRFDELIEREEAEREVIGKSDHKSGIGNEVKGHYTVGGTKAEFYDITAPATPQAKALDGSYAGFQPKPAVEVIIVAMKPLSEKTYVDQALANGKGITWLDDVRIPYQNEDDRSQTADKANKDIDSYKNIPEQVYGKARHEYIGEFGNPQGRFPANLLVSDDVLNDGRITKSRAYPRRECKTPEGNTYMTDKPTGQEHNDSGSYSRYFDLDKWAEKTLPFLIVPKASNSEKNKGFEELEGQQVNDGRTIPPDNAFQRGATVRKNTHPTVKPVKLLTYLISMGSRPGDLVLDPFNGSGSTGIAAKLLGRNYIGVEMELEYVNTSNLRINAWKPDDLNKIVFKEEIKKTETIKVNPILITAPPNPNGKGLEKWFT